MFRTVICNANPLDAIIKSSVDNGEREVGRNVSHLYAAASLRGEEKEGHFWGGDGSWSQ